MGIALDNILNQFVDNAGSVLGIVCLLLSGMFSLASGSRRSTSNRLAALMGEKLVSLQPLRSAMQAKARSQFSAGLISIASLFFLSSVLFELKYSLFQATLTLVSILVLSLLIISMLDKMVEKAMRRSLLKYISNHAFVFEDNIALSQEIGSLFGVEATDDDTLESFLKKLREALGLRQPASKMFGARNPHYSIK
ncbi:MAG: hypothetical protein H8E25_02435 [Planctomycetes bacterium]|nr:hypothetical protein [Planctomycetota bacterium]